MKLISPLNVSKKVLALFLMGYFSIFSPAIALAQITQPASAPITIPVPIPVTNAPEIVYPQNGQTLDLEGAYMFKVKPVTGATGYLFGLFQNGVMVYENWRDDKQLSPNGEFVVWQSNPFHAKFKAGTAIVMIRAKVNNQWTDSRDLTITLKPRTLLPTPTPNPTPIGIGTTNPIGIGVTNPMGIGITNRISVINNKINTGPKPYIKNLSSWVMALRNRFSLFLYRYINR